MTSYIYWEFGSGHDSIRLLYKVDENTFRMRKLCLHTDNAMTMSNCGPIEMCKDCGITTPSECVGALESLSAIKLSTLSALASLGINLQTLKLLEQTEITKNRSKCYG
jgi:hypothetical protein